MSAAHKDVREKNGRIQSPPVPLSQGSILLRSSERASEHMEDIPSDRGPLSARANKQQLRKHPTSLSAVAGERNSRGDSALEVVSRQAGE